MENKDNQDAPIITLRSEDFKPDMNFFASGGVKIMTITHDGKLVFGPNAGPEEAVQAIKRVWDSMGAVTAITNDMLSNAVRCAGFDYDAFLKIKAYLPPLWEQAKPPAVAWRWKYGPGESEGGMHPNEWRFSATPLMAYRDRIIQPLFTGNMLPTAELTWLYTHCRAIGMTCKSDSGKWEEDIALFTINQKDEIAALRAEVKRRETPVGHILVSVADPKTGPNYEAGDWSRRNWQAAMEDQIAGFNVVVDPTMQPNSMRLESGQNSVTANNIDGSKIVSVDENALIVRVKRLEDALRKIANVNAMDYEYVQWAREALAPKQ